ncbi:hypothetical protein BJV78DRAFT_1219173 [Lactifluus subvellereus]|nr:hypothetical protein BJV78DRAFT_1219173 [Lactifluus subvellereus]
MDEGTTGEVVGNSGAFPPRSGGSRGIDMIGFHVCRAVVSWTASEGSCSFCHRMPVKL